VALPIAAGALTPANAVAMTAIMRMVGAIMGVGALQFFAAQFVAVVPSRSSLLSTTTIGTAVALAWACSTWWRGVAVSSSPALTASITGAAVAIPVLDTDPLIWADLSTVSIGIIISLFASPILAML